MGAPLRVGDEVLGALFVHGTEVGQFLDRDLQLLEFLATQASSAIQNALQFAKTESALGTVERQARYQFNISQAVAQLNQQGGKALNDVLQLLGETAGVERAFYAEVQGDPRDLYWRIAASWVKPGLPSVLGRPELQRLPVSQFPFIEEQLRVTGSVQRPLSEFPTAERQVLAALEIKSMLALAVSQETVTPGFIGLTSGVETLLLGRDEIAALQTAVTAVSNTLARERLFQQVEDTLAETETLYKASARLNQAVSYEGILTVMREFTLLGQGASDVTILLFNHPWTDDKKPDYADVMARYIGDKRQVMRQPRHLLSDFPASDEIMAAEFPTFIEDAVTAPRVDEK